MAGNLVWKSLTAKQLEKLQLQLEPGEESANKVKSLLAEFLDLSRADVDRRARIIVDFHFFNLAFCKVSC